MSVHWASFFDSENQTLSNSGGNEDVYSIWSRSDPRNQMSLDPNDILYEGHLWKLEGKSGNFKSRYFYLTKNRMYFEKAKGRGLKGFMDLSFMRLVTINQDSSTKTNDGFKLRFIKNLKYCELFVKNITDLESWKAALTPVLIRTDFHERFFIEKNLGEGAFAKVYKVKTKEDNALYAVKAFSAETISSTKDGKKGLMCEIEILSKLNHPNIAKLHEVHETKNSIYMVYELVPGKSLGQLLHDSDDYLTTAQIKALLEGLLRALSYLEEQGVVHRDIKPDNIMLACDKLEDMTPETVKLCDFGFATEHSRNFQLFPSCGTPGYAPPECLMEGEIKLSQNWDCFSTGVLVYLLITGDLPFPGVTPDEVVTATLLGTVDYENTRFKQSPEKLRKLLQKLLEKDPKNRISASQALKDSYFPTFKKNQISKSHLKLENQNQISLNCDSLFDNSETSPTRNRIASINCSKPKQVASKDSPTHQKTIFTSKKLLIKPSSEDRGIILPPVSSPNKSKLERQSTACSKMTDGSPLNHIRLQAFLSPKAEGRVILKESSLNPFSRKGNSSMPRTIKQTSMKKEFMATNLQNAY